MKKSYKDPEFELIKMYFDNVLKSQGLSDPENSASDGDEFEGNV